MDGLTLLLILGAGWLMGHGGQQSQSPPVCPPVVLPRPPARLMQPAETEYVLPPALRSVPQGQGVKERVSRAGVIPNGDG